MVAGIIGDARTLLATAVFVCKNADFHIILLGRGLSAFFMGGNSTKKIRSFTLCERSYLKLKKHADKEHKGNMSNALRALILKAIPTTLEDFDHHAPEGARNYLGSGKCNPKVGGFPCALCWGENAVVLVKDALVEKNGRWVTERVIHVENA